MHIRWSCRFFFLFAIAMLQASTAEAQSTYYVRASATGSNNGSSWYNACTALPATLNVAQRTTLLMATTAVTLSTTLSPVLRESPSTKGDDCHHDTEVGWLDSYGDGQAIITQTIDRCLNVQSSYWIFDGNGQIGTYGFKIVGTVGDPNPPPGNRLFTVGTGNPNVLTDIIVKSWELDGGQVNFIDLIGISKLNGGLFSNIWGHDVEDDVVEGCEPCDRRELLNTSWWTTGTEATAAARLTRTFLICM